MSRAGVFVKQASGYRAFHPAPLPPDPPLRLDGEVLRWLSKADRALGRLDGVTSTLPNPDLFVGMYVRQEAVLSSQIEGTQSTLEDVLAFEAHAPAAGRPLDVGEVVNYVDAMRHGLAQVSGPDGLPLSLRLLREIHARLLAGTRGSTKQPGDFRTSQNWIGAQGSTLRTATFVPPPVPVMHEALSDLERFLYDRALPDLVVAGLAHAQFETVHPFLDGNGRVGRLLITFLLCERQILARPLLYLSIYFKRHRAEYYDRLTAVREQGDWEGWLAFFLRGVFEVSEEATRTARAILALRERHRAEASAFSGKDNTVLVDVLFRHPYLSVGAAAALLNVNYVTASRMVERFEAAGWLEEITGQARNRVFRYAPYLALFDTEGGGDDDGDPGPAVRTQA